MKASITEAGYGSWWNIRAVLTREGAAGPQVERLQRLVLGLTVEEYLDRYDRVNLCRGAWSAPAASSAAEEVLRTAAGPVVALGAKVSAAFRLLFRPFSSSVVSGDGVGRSVTVVCLPHPSGLSRAWNEAGTFERARAALRAAEAL